MINDQVAQGASKSLSPLVVMGELALLAGGEHGREEAQSGAEALLANGAATVLLKKAFHDRRPTGESFGSFPSGHASTAFAMATILSEYHPKYTYLTYGAASFIAVSRIEVRAHKWDDIIAGAALGHFIARRSLRHHLFVTPRGLGFQEQW